MNEAKIHWITISFEKQLLILNIFTLFTVDKIRLD